MGFLEFIKEEQITDMYAFGLLAGMVVVGFFFAKLRGRNSGKPSVTSLMPPKQ